MNKSISDLITDSEIRIHKFSDTLQAESDRGCALVSAAYLDESLKQLLLKSFVKDKLSQKILDKELQPFSFRIEMAFLLGKINRIAYRDLHLIRKIRNQFGHSEELITFESPQIRDRCSELQYANKAPNQTPRLLFISATCTLLGAIDAVAVQAPTPLIRTSQPPNSFLREICKDKEVPN